MLDLAKSVFISTWLIEIVKRGVSTDSQRRWLRCARLQEAGD